MGPSAEGHAPGASGRLRLMLAPAWGPESPMPGLRSRWDATDSNYHPTPRVAPLLVRDQQFPPPVFARPSSAGGEGAVGAEVLDRQVAAAEDQNELTVRSEAAL